MKYFYTYKEAKGYDEIVDEESILDFIKFGLIKLDKNESINLESGEYETVLVIMSGKCDVECDDLEFKDLGKRKDVFSGRPTSVYIPKQCGYKITASGEGILEIGVCMVKADKKYEPFVVYPEDVIIVHRGVLNWQREVEDIIIAKYEGKVDKIIVGETYSCPGQWSSYPPHKHDKDNKPYETNMEELYHFRVDPPQGFGIQVMYKDDFSQLNECYIIRNGDTAVIKDGYHPVASAPGYQVYYLWVMAGINGRMLTPFDDPKHAWLRAVEKMVK